MMRRTAAAPLVVAAVALLVCFGGALAAFPLSKDEHKTAKYYVSGDSDFKYPKGLPDPPLLWVEGFAARLHAKDVQKFETPIQVSL